MDTQYTEPDEQETEPELDSIVEVYIDLDYTTYALLHKEAQAAGVPDCTHISNVLHKYASGKLKKAM